MRVALGSAEALTGRFYCIPGREWARFPYDVRTLAAGTGPDERAFADVVRLRATGRCRPQAFPERFRIRLRDDAILRAVHDRPDGPGLYPLLLYVLTHELVHVVRFGEGRARFDAPHEERVAEERRVHEITRRVLHPARDAALDPVLRLYERHFEASEAGASSPK